MEAFIVFLFCAATTVTGQLLNPLAPLGIGTGWGNSGLWHSGMRYPGVMQTSQLNSMTYPTWRSHPLFRMAPAMTEKKVESSDAVNVVNVPSAQEVLTHMALASQNPKAFLDTIADFLYEPQKVRTVVAPVTTFGSGLPISPIATAPAVSSPMYVQGANLMRASTNIPDDCGPEGGRWTRGLDWLY